MKSQTVWLRMFRSNNRQPSQSAHKERAAGWLAGWLGGPAPVLASSRGRRGDVQRMSSRGHMCSDKGRGAAHISEAARLRRTCNCNLRSRDRWIICELNMCG
jgi:hypothetical protein